MKKKMAASESTQTISVYLYVYPSSGEETVCHLSKKGLTYKLVFASGNFIFSRAKCVIASNDN